jgi:uncharacterized protein YfdQ (DUF2303 family)
MRTACQEEQKANKTYRQLTFPAVTISDLQRREDLDDFMKNQERFREVLGGLILCTTFFGSAA